MNIKRAFIFLASAAAALIISCTPDKNPAQNAPEKENPERTFYAKGADISWTSQMEAEGMKFYNRQGEEKECTELMKEIGMNSIRLRVWVNPKDGWCSKEDVLNKALRAQALGMNIMIDFHYSDTWADPGHQTVPSAWQSYDITQMTQAVAAHTSEVLNLLKGKGIDVKWVQTGNEVNSGMLWPIGKVQDSNALNFTRLINAGHDAVKKIYPDAAVILHLSNGHEAGLYTWFFDLIKAYGGKYDMIGMSLYPVWWENGGWNDWKIPAQECISNMKNLTARYGKPVMLVETGGRVHEPEISKEMLGYLISETKKIKECHGVFYWEPQAPKGYNDGYEMGAFADGRPTAALDPFKN